MIGVFTLFCTGYVSYLMNKPFSLDVDFRLHLLHEITQRSIQSQSDSDFIWVIFYNSDIIDLKQDNLSAVIIDISKNFCNFESFLIESLVDLNLDWVFDLDSDDAISKDFVHYFRSNLGSYNEYDAIAVYDKYLWINQSSMRLLRSVDQRLVHAWFKPACMKSYNHREHFRFFKQLKHMNVLDPRMSYLITVHTDHVGRYVNKLSYVKPLTEQETKQVYHQFSYILGDV